MATTKQEVELNFYITRNQKSYKIIELPPELLAVLESENPPSLCITSAPDAASNVSRGLKPDTALITHGTTRYSMRSKNTSNPMLLLQPSSLYLNESGQASGDKNLPSVVAISQCEETIELILVDENPELERIKVNKWHEKFGKSRGK